MFQLHPPLIGKFVSFGQSSEGKFSAVNALDNFEFGFAVGYNNVSWICKLINVFNAERKSEDDQ